MISSSLQDMAKYYSTWWENPQDPRGVVFFKLTCLVAQRLGRATAGHTRALDLGSGCGSIIESLQAAGYEATGVEYGEEAARKLSQRFPTARIIQADLNTWTPDGTYDVVTMIELVQNFSAQELLALMKKLRPVTRRILINAPNRHSLQGWWVRWRKMQAPFVTLYGIKEFESILKQAGFTITYRRGVGMLMPISLLDNFRIILIPRWLVRLGNALLDPLFPSLAALYYVELE